MLLLRSGVVAVAAGGSLLVSAAPALAADPVMPLASVQAGMTCTALSVVQGDTPVSFDATVIGVSGGPRPADALIIMRFSGSAIAGTGIGQGFSGSPVYCPDGTGTQRVIGAISQGIGQYDNFVGGVTPIEAILATPTFGAGAAIPALGASSTASRAAAAPWGTGRPTLQLSGPRGALATRLAAAATKAGIPMRASGTATRHAITGTTLAPGDSVAATLVTGDVISGAIGTVTYVDGDRVWAFGHPFNGSGAVRMLMQRASIVTVVGSPSVGEQVSYKLGDPTNTVGTIGFDGTSAIGGVLGAGPSLIGTDVTVRDAAGKVLQTGNANVIDERSVRGANTPQLLGLGAAANAGAAMQRTFASAAVAGSARTCTTISLVGGLKPLLQCTDAIVPSPDASVGGAETGVAGAVTEALSPVLSAERFTRLIGQVHVDVTYRPEADAASIVRVRLPKRVKAGRTVNARVVLTQESTGVGRVLTIPVKIPRSAAGVRTGISILSFAAEAPSPISDDALTLLLGGSLGADEGVAPRNLAALRALYTQAGISGIRVLVTPGLSGSRARRVLEGDDTNFDDAEAAELARRVVVGRELPTVQLSGGAAVTVRPTR